MQGPTGQYKAQPYPWYPYSGPQEYAAEPMPDEEKDERLGELLDSVLAKALGAGVATLSSP
jgi:hypothetical protein